MTVGPDRTVDMAGPPGAPVEATFRTPDDDGCLANQGTLLVLALPTTGPDGRDAIALLIVNGDTAGGPATPAVPARETLDAVIDSARLATI